MNNKSPMLNRVLFTFIQNGRQYEYEMEQPSFHKLRNLIGCQTAEMIFLKGDAIMLCDEDAIRKELRPNMAATVIRNRQHRLHPTNLPPIRGDVIIINKHLLDHIPYE